MQILRCFLYKLMNDAKTDDASDFAKHLAKASTIGALTLDFFEIEQCYAKSAFDFAGDLLEDAAGFDDFDNLTR